MYSEFLHVFMIFDLPYFCMQLWFYIYFCQFLPDHYCRPTMEHIDEEDPFLPPSSAMMNARRNRETYGSTGFRPRSSHTPPQTPYFYASLWASIWISCASALYICSRISIICKHCWLSSFFFLNLRGGE